VNTEIVEHGKTGFLAATPEQWREHLAELIQDWRLRRDMGMRARASVERRYTVETVLPGLVKVFGGQMHREGAGCANCRQGPLRPAPSDRPSQNVPP
jgi:glycosyltransferase involved in cell wall biosynthesis